MLLLSALGTALIILLIFEIGFGVLCTTIKVFRTSVRDGSGKVVKL